MSPSTTMRVLVVGDRWDYDVTGSAELAGRVLPLAGTITVTIEQRNAGGAARSAVVFAQHRRIVGVDGPAGEFPMPTGVFYFAQDPDRLDVSIVGDNMGPQGRDRFAAVPRVFYPGRWSAQTRYDNVLDFGEDGTVANLLETIGVESIATGIGTLAAWKTTIASKSPQFGDVRGHDWWAPELGAPAKFEMTARGPDGALLSSAAILRATNVV